MTDGVRYDSIVVGAGPAGSLAAHDLAVAGARVLLVDRADFPRDKPCGGGVLIGAARHLPFSIEPVVERTLSDFRVRYRRDWTFE
ncbi:MAG: FAD-dependent oxidoreductase, partial [Chloroflexota bacterium]|nr:FAD-dependent oxidoreductase [Chloroflexota bacterium]